MKLNFSRSTKNLNLSLTGLKLRFFIDHDKLNFLNMGVNGKMLKNVIF